MNYITTELPFNQTDNSRSGDQQQLSEEIELLRSVGKHPHIVSIIACCTSAENPCLLMEYCALGDLRSYLQKARTNQVISSDEGLPKGK